MIGRHTLRYGLHLSLAIWIAAVAAAPLWHADHEAPLHEGAPEHHHPAGAWLCAGGPEAIDRNVDCVLCMAQRLLSHGSARAPVAIAGPGDGPAPVRPALPAPRASGRIPLFARAPPSC
jgi:hypothetical protein